MPKNAAIAPGVLLLTTTLFVSNARAQSWFAPSGDLGPSPAPVQGPDRAKPARPARGPEIVYLNTEGGFQSLSLTTLRASGLVAQTVAESGSAAFYGFGAGFRFGFFTVGARYRGAGFSAGNLSTVDGELGARITLARFEPYFTFGFGYARLGSSGASQAGFGDQTIGGINGRAGLGFDYYADKILTIGANVTGDLLAMTPPGVSLTTSPRTQADEKVAACASAGDPQQVESCLSSALQQAQGSSFGFSATVSLVVGLHF